MENYIVLCKSYEDLQSLYEDMETPGGNLYIPDRAVECTNRRSISRNTIYLLSESEAEQLRNDPRVQGVEKLDLVNEKTIEPRGWSQFSDDWDKNTSGTETGTEKNWALRRCTMTSQSPTGWGYNGLAVVTDTVVSMYSGYNVDVIITDGHLDPTHPEFTTNPDGSGSTRVRHLDWDMFNNPLYGLTSDLPTTRGSYIYGDGNGGFTEYGSDHGMHVAGTVSGNTQGWARGATIYNISPYSTGNPNNSSYYYNLFDYIRMFHRYKPINPITGRRNPTVVNASWGGFYSITASGASVVFRGQTVTTDASSNTTTDFQNWALPNNSTTSNLRTAIHGNGVNSGFSRFYLADATDMIAEGIVLVTAAGNALEWFAKPGDQDYNNYIDDGVYTHFYCRGDEKTYGGVSGFAIGNLESYYIQLKRISSARGPGIDCWAPGSAIMSAVHEIGDGGSTGKVDDLRNPIYKLAKFNGTSMASPQVAGVLACLLEQNPELTHEDCRSLLQGELSIKNQIDPSYTSADHADPWWLGDDTGESNRHLYLKQKRYDNGPNQFLYKGNRPTQGVIYPRPRYTKISTQNVTTWYDVYIVYASQSPAHYKVSGIDYNGEFTNRDSSTTAININVGEAIAFSNMWGSGAINTSHPMAISSTVGGSKHADVVYDTQESYTFIPQSTGTYYYYCIYHTSMYGQIIVS